MPGPKRIQVFISSPADVDPERKVVDRVIARLASVWKSHIGLTARNWVSEDYEAIRSFQESIAEMKTFDIVFGVVWKRIGSPLRPDMFRRTDGTPYESGTVYEIETALASSAASGSPAVYLFRKDAPVSYSAENFAEEQRQHHALRAWWDSTVSDAGGHNVRGFGVFTDLDEFEERIANLLEKFLRDRKLIPDGAAWDIATKGSPYPGLLPYDRHFETVFFGRNLAIAAALEDLQAAAKRGTPALFIVGPSGSGKSSLARAGLLPRFVNGSADGAEIWRQAVLEPAEEPFRTLARQLHADVLPRLADSAQPTPEAFSALALQAPDLAADAIRWALDDLAKSEQAQRGGGKLPVCRLVLVVDQLEILLDGPDGPAITQFMRTLIDNESAWLIATLRSDRYTALQRDSNLVELRHRGALYDLPAPGSAELDDIIKGPARAARLEFEERDGRSLAKIISAAAGGADALPLLQMTLCRLFGAREDNRLTFRAYEEMGGLGGAIASHAQEVFEQAPPEAQATLDALLGALVTDVDKDGTLTVRTLDLATITGPALELATRLIEARLLANTDGGVRIAHEALLRRWQRASESPALRPETIRLRRQIERSLETWQRTNKPSDLLPPDTTLLLDADIIVRKYPGAFPTDLEEYVWMSIRASQDRAKEAQLRAEAEAQAARRRARLAVGAAVAFALVAIFALITYQAAQNNFNLALLSNAQQFMRKEKPTRVFVLARNAARRGLLSYLTTMLPIAGATNDEDVAAASLAKVAAPASSVPLRTIMFSHPADAVAFATHDNRFAIGDQHGEVFVESADGRSEIHLLGHTARINSVRFSPDDTIVASASDDKTVRLWNLATRQAVALCGQSGRVNDVSFDPKRRYLASASNDGSVIVWSLATLQAVTRFDRPGSTRFDRPGSIRWALAVDFSQDGRELAFSYDDGMVFVQSTSDWSVKELKTDLGDIISIAFSPDGSRIAIASIEGQLQIWNVADARKIGEDEAATGQISRVGTLHAEITDYPDKLWKVRFSLDGRFLVSASWDGTARLWDGKTFRYLGAFDGNDQWVTDVAFSSDSMLLATADESGVTRIWRTADVRPMFQVVHDDTLETLAGAYSPDGTRFVTGGRDRLARLYRVDAQGNLSFLCKVPHDDWVFSLTFLNDGRSVASAGAVEGKPDNVIKIWAADDTCAIQKTIPTGTGVVGALAASRDGSYLAWAGHTGEVMLVGTGRDMQQTSLPNPPTGAIYTLDFSQDGKFLAAAGQSGVVVLWDAATKERLSPLPRQLGMVEALAFAPDRNLLAAAGADGRVQIWNLAVADHPLAASLEMRGAANSATFSKDGKFLAVGGDARYLAIWSVPNWTKEFELDGLVGVRGVFGFAPGNGDLAFDGENGLVRILPDPLRSRSTALAVPASVRGTEVLFDLIAPTVSSENPALDIKASSVCQPPPTAAATAATAEQESGTDRQGD
jgi:WD40 repeat protein